jgi:ribonucleoside-diphosphate reductase alpha chain
MTATRRTSPHSPRGPRRSRLPLSANARVVLERRYLARDESGRLIEKPEDLFRRVAHNIAAAEKSYGASKEQVATWEERFYSLLTSLRFLPNSPTLGNAGRPLQQLSACFVLPVEDSMTGIFDAIKHTALIHQSGGGTGFAFSRLRPAGDRVQSTGGIASGPVSFMRVFDAATEAIKQGGTRRGANMAILAVEHPDIEEFINLKSDMVTLTNFNISVAASDQFMGAVERNEEYELVNPRSGQVVRRLNARHVFRQIVENAWKNGDPGLVFLDHVNRDNPTPQLGRIEATNPCGEQPLLPYESCNLGSLDVSKFIREEQARSGKQQGGRRGLVPFAAGESASGGSSQFPVPGGDVDWEGLAELIPLCVRFLDDVIDMNLYPMPEIEEKTKLARKIGLGVMGWADLLFRLGIPYHSEQALSLGERLMTFIQEHADRASEELARERGVFPAWKGSIYEKAGRRLRNATRTTVAPTGTLSIIADCSAGIEPVFALAFVRQHFLDPKDPGRVTQLSEVDKYFQEAARREGFHSTELMEELARVGSLKALSAGRRRSVPASVRRVFVTAHDISPEWHVRMQAAFQRHTDNAVSKTINFPETATPDDVEKAYLLAYREGCKGITIYRDRSREMQVLSHATLRGPEQAEAAAAEVAMSLPPGVLPPAGRAAVPYRRRLPDERRSLTHKFRVGEQEGYLTVGLFEDGSPGEVFITISKEGSTIRGLMDSLAVMTSLALQYGVPIENLAAKFKGVRFEPYGFSSNPEIPQASSIVDYIFRWLELKFARKEPGSRKQEPGRRRGAGDRPLVPGSSDGSSDVSTGLLCPECGAILVFAEGCLVCRRCGYNKCG